MRLTHLTGIAAIPVFEQCAPIAFWSGRKPYQEDARDFYERKNYYLLF